MIICSPFLIKAPHCPRHTAHYWLDLIIKAGVQYSLQSDNKDWTVCPHLHCIKFFSLQKKAAYVCAIPTYFAVTHKFYISPESTLAIIFLDFQADGEGKQVTVRGEGSSLLRWQNCLLSRPPKRCGKAVQYPAHLQEKGEHAQNTKFRHYNRKSKQGCLKKCELSCEL